MIVWHTGKMYQVEILIFSHDRCNNNPQESFRMNFYVKLDKVLLFAFTTVKHEFHKTRHIEEKLISPRGKKKHFCVSKIYFTWHV